MKIVCFLIVVLFLFFLLFTKIKAWWQLIVVLLLIVITIVFPNYIPVKFAVHDNESIRNGSYVIVKWVRTTGYDWYRLEDSYDNPSEYLKLTGNIPLERFPRFGIREGSNRFICYGNYIDKNLSNEEKSDTFFVDNWDIIYPIGRNSFRPIAPKSYIVPYDYVD